MKSRTKKAKAKEEALKAVRERPPANPVKVDPTKTGMIRRRAEADLKKRFSELSRRITQAIGEEDALGLVGNVYTVTNNGPNWKTLANPEKIKAFREWLEEQLGSVVLGKTEEELWTKYVEEGLRKGAARAFDDVKKTERALAYGDNDKLNFYEGSKAQFLEASFNQPVAVEKVKLLAGRAYGDLKGVTDSIATKMVRKLTDGLVQGQSPKEIGRSLAIEIDISIPRATTIARTEIIRAHAEGQLDAMEEMGVEEVGVAVEWATAGDDRVCDLCAPLEGVVLKLDEARGMLPRHPNCRCAWIPANVGESEKDQKKSKKEVSSSISKSEKAEAKKGTNDEQGDWGPGSSISKTRPTSILDK